MGDKRTSSLENLTIPSAKRAALKEDEPEEEEEEEEEGVEQSEKDLLKFQNKQLVIRLHQLKNNVALIKKRHESIFAKQEEFSFITEAVEKNWEEMENCLKEMFEKLKVDEEHPLFSVLKQTERTNEVLEDFAEETDLDSLEEFSDLLNPTTSKESKETVKSLTNTLTSFFEHEIIHLNLLQSSLKKEDCEKMKESIDSFVSSLCKLSKKQNEMGILSSLSHISKMKTNEYEYSLTLYENMKSYFDQKYEQNNVEIEEENDKLEVVEDKEMEIEENITINENEKECLDDVKSESGPENDNEIEIEKESQEKDNAKNQEQDKEEKTDNKKEEGEKNNEENDDKKVEKSSEPDLVELIRIKTKQSKAVLEDLKETKDELAKVKGETEVLRLQSRIIPEHMIIESHPFKSVQSQRNNILKEIQDARLSLEDYRNQAAESYRKYKQAVDSVESHSKLEVDCKKNIKEAESKILADKKEIDKIKSEMDRKNSMKEANVVNKEMRSLIASLQIENSHLAKDLLKMQEKAKQWERTLAKDDLDDNHKVLRARLVNACKTNNQTEIDKTLTSIKRVFEIHKEKQESGDIMSEMSTIIQAYDEIQEQNSRLGELLKNKEKRNTELMDQHLTSHRKQQAALEEKKAIMAKIELMQKKHTHSDELVKSFLLKEMQFTEQTKMLEKDLTLKAQNVETSRKKAIEQAQAFSELKLLHSKFILDKELLVKNHDAKESDLQKAVNLRKELEDECTELTLKIKQYNNAKSGSSQIHLEEEVESYRSFLNCGLCKRRRKDTLLTKCFHAFCNQCIQERYDTRQRKCPNCLDPFGVNDFRRFKLCD